MPSISFKPTLDAALADYTNQVSIDLATYPNFLSGHMAGAVPILRPRNQPPNTVQPVRKRGEKVKPLGIEQPPLHTASEKGQLDVVQLLLDRGWDVDEMNGSRNTALQEASSSGRLEVAKLLIERGANGNSRNRSGLTPLLHASLFGHLEVTRLLLDHGADVYATTRFQQTALHLGSANGYLQICLLLVERGALADVDARNAYGRTPRQNAMAHGHHRIAEVLIGGSTYGAWALEDTPPR